MGKVGSSMLLIQNKFFALFNHNKTLEHFQNGKSDIEENAYENPFIMLRLELLY